MGRRFPPALLQAEVLYRSGGSKPEAMRVLESPSKADHLSYLSSILSAHTCRQNRCPPLAKRKDEGTTFSTLEVGHALDCTHKEL